MERRWYASTCVYYSHTCFKLLSHMHGAHTHDLHNVMHVCVCSCDDLTVIVQYSRAQITLSLSLSHTHTHTHTPHTRNHAPLTPLQSQHQDMYESLDDNFFSADISGTEDVSARAMKRPLMPQSCSNPDTLLQHFTRNFGERYGSTHPVFYVGSLSAAVKEATSGSASSGMVRHV